VDWLGILKAWGRKPPVNQPEVSPLLDQGGRSLDVSRAYYTDLLLHQDHILRSQGGAGWNALDIYAKVRSDPQVKACWQQRTHALLSLPVKVEVGLPRGRAVSKVDEMARDFWAERVLAGDWDGWSELAHWGVFYGYSVAELTYVRDGNYVQLDRVLVRDRRRFRFDPQGNLRLLTPTDYVRGINLTAEYPGRFWHYSSGADHCDDPYGLGLAHWLYWLVLFKRGNMSEWLSFLEKKAGGMLLGRFPAGTDPSQQSKLLSTLEALKSNGGAVLPEGWLIEFLNSNSGAGPEFDQLYSQLEKAIAKTILGQTATTEGTEGKLGNEQERAQVKDELVHADNDLIYGSFRRGPVAWLSRFNFGEDVAVPIISRDFDTPEDTNQLAERDVKIHSLGFKPTLEYIRSTYGEGWLERNEPLELPQEKPPVAFGEMDAVGKIAQMLRPGVLAGLGDWVREIEALLQDSQDLVEFRGKLAEIYPQLSVQEVAAQLAQALVLADLVGRSEVLEGG